VGHGELLLKAVNTLAKQNHEVARIGPAVRRKW
jgi:hypothetical protein